MKLRGQMKRANNQKGFTLVELMVVVVIIGILAAVAVPTYGNITAKAKDKANDANIRILESAIQAYLSENEGDYENLTLAEDGAIAGTGVTVGSLIPKYIKDMPKSPYDSTNTNSYTKAKDGNVEVNK